MFHIGSEHRSWLLYYSLPVLYSILPLPYFKHYSLLVGSVHILMSDHISLNDLEVSKRWLNTFYKDFMELYGKTVYTYNSCDSSAVMPFLNLFR